MTTSERSPNTVRVLTAFFMVGTFAAGIAAGVGLTLWLHDNGEPSQGPVPMLRRLPLEMLSLSQEQWEEVRNIVEARRPALEAIVEETFPRVGKINDEIDAEILTILTEKQREELEEIQTRRQERRRGGPGGPKHSWGEGGGPFGGPQFGPGHEPGGRPLGPPPFSVNLPPRRQTDAGPPTPAADR